MRLIFGIVLGIALTLGAAFLRDRTIAEGPSLPRLEPLAAQRIVNWDVFQAVMRKAVRHPAKAVQQARRE